MPADPLEPLEPPDEPPPLAPPLGELLGEPEDGEPPPDCSSLQPPTISSALTSDATIVSRARRASARDAETVGAEVFIAKCL